MAHYISYIVVILSFGYSYVTSISLCAFTSSAASNFLRQSTIFFVLVTGQPNLAANLCDCFTGFG